jgi:MATE family multidrug resistance protein
MLKKWFHRNSADFRLINDLVVPMLFLQILQLLFQLGDQAIIGRLGVEEFAAVGIASSFIFLITGTIGILCAAFNIIGGRFFGNNDIPKFGQAFNTSMTMSIMIGIMFELLLLGTGRWILGTVYDLNFAPATHYLYISGMTMGMNMVLFNFSAYFKNINQAKLLTFSFVAAGIVNIFFDYVLVFGKWGFPALGMSGAAVGSVAGYGASIIVCIYFFRKSSLFSFSLQINRPIAKQLLKLYFPMALQDLIEYTLFAMGIMAIISRLDSEFIASYTVVTTLLEIIMIPMYCFAGSCMTITAKAYGTQQAGYTKYSYLSLQLMLMISIPLTLIVISFSYPLIAIITDKAVVISLVEHVLPLALALNLMNGLQMIMRSTLQAIDLEKWVLVYSGVVYAVSLVIIYVCIRKLELTGVYLGFGVSYLLLSLGYVYKLQRREPYAHAKTLSR